ncbi:hypothetical protein F4808DRAFT_468118 [Astrocystis sublimbata]|nr:hypothetical protein F4808DRAFT_468118 [Astrocystis sublimbata]
MSEDVSRFLSQVKELGERRVEEDEARSRELEEKILRDREERQARRRERARSISPQKSSPANTPPPPQFNDGNRPERLGSLASPVLYPPSSSQSQSAPAAGEDNMTDENESPLESEIKPSHPPSPTRNGSTASERSRSRPLSVFAAENATRSSNHTPEPDTAAEHTPSREQIASALSSKDPSWFRQTADRGADSAAYRKTQVEDAQTVDMPSLRTQLPGMSRSTSGESFRNGDNSTLESVAPRGTVTSPTNLSSAQRLDPPSNNNRADIDAAKDTLGPLSPALGRTSPTRTDRPVSPTKGMGGFVQSAMMKRSESVNKRWNVSSPTGLQRGDSIVSNRSSYHPSGSTSITPKSRSSSGESKAEDRSASRTEAALKLETAVSPDPESQDTGKVTPPVSPSKTMDPRRWSPTKASWLDSALNKPESPKPKPSQPPPKQPAWMVEIQKAKAQKSSNPGTEPTKSPAVSHRHQVSIGGLMRSGPPGINTTPVGRAGLHSPSPSVSSIKAPVASVQSSEPQPPAATSPVKSHSEPVGEIKTALPAASKVKPETPPKKDFRASLKPKPRAPEPTASTGSGEPEFKNVFGHLRRATTQNYKAPDVLKDNITRSKAALNITGGPQKTERVDEFKDAILAKKSQFQAAQSEGRSVARKNSVVTDQPVPEGLLKRAELGRSGTVKRSPATADVPETDVRTPIATPQRNSVAGGLAGRLDRFSTLEKRASIISPSSSKPEGQGTPTEPSAVRKLPSFSRPTSGSTDSDQTLNTNGPARVPGKIGGSALANRFNPALAGLLARGPPSAAPAPGSNSVEAASKSSKSEVNDNEAGSGPKLTHMTKSRARGPKRKAPTKSSAPPTASGDSKPESPKRPRVDDTTAQPETTTPSSRSNSFDPFNKGSATYISPHPKPLNLTRGPKLSNDSTTASSGAAVDRSKPGSGIHEQVAAFTAQEQQPITGKISDEPQQISPSTPSPSKLNLNRFSQFVPAASTKGKESEPEQSRSPEILPKSRGFLDRPSTQDIQQKPQTRSPSLNKPKVPLPTASPQTPKQQSPKIEANVTLADPENKEASPAGPRPLPKPPVLRSSLSSESSPRPLPQEPERASRSLPTPAPKSPAAAAAASPLRSPTSQPPDTSVMLREFFGTDRPRRDYHVDAAQLLMQRPYSNAPKIKTSSAQLFQFSADGKKQPVPAHHERTLFEHEMYICTHAYTTEAGWKKMDVYFWTGDEVPKAAIEDASIFAIREARFFGGALVKIQQGRETPEFMQALGGIVVTQRGSRNKYDSLAPHMLCGRRHHGHVVFDEVDFTSSAMCSGFPYLITQAGKCYLWKGKGSSVNEVSCARLIGMDYALTGELEEVEEGSEPAGFWDLFGGASRFGSADHWRLKPNYDKYSSRLFLSEAASKQQIAELSVFSQSNLSPASIYVIDAFFELYIVVGSRAQAQYASFHNALDFAQEYAILAASVEDRPFVPVSTVVLEGIPRDMKSVFRKWHDELSPTVMNANKAGAGAGLKRGRSLKVVSLGQALQALSD